MKYVTIVAFFLTLVECICNTSATRIYTHAVSTKKLDIIEPLCSLILNLKLIYYFLFTKLFRHGVRAPDFLYPTDPLQNVSSFWPNGLAQLTDVS